MGGFFNKNISSFAGIIILLLITAAIGAFIIYQFKEINDIRFGVVESQNGFDLRD